MDCGSSAAICRPFASDDLTTLVKARAPSLDDAAVAALTGWSPNPLALEAVLDGWRVRRRLMQKLPLSQREIAELPGSIGELFVDVWRELPEATQAALALASIYGERFPPTFVVDAARALASPVSLEDLDQGQRPYRWTRIVDWSVHAFAEPMLYAVAKNRIDQFFNSDEVGLVRKALVEATTDWDRTRLSRLGFLELLRAHVSLAEKELVPRDSAAIASALTLASPGPGSTPLAEALPRIDAVAKWSALPDDQLAIATARAWCFGSNGHFREAVADLTISLKSLDGAHDHRSRTALAARNDIAFWTSRTRDWPRARALYEDLLPCVRHALGVDDRLAIRVEGNLAEVIGESGDVNLALERTKKVVSRSSRVLGRDAPNTLVQRSYLASWTHSAGKLSRAIKLLESLVPKLDKFVGRDDSPTVMARKNLAAFLWEAKRYRQALDMVLETETDIVYVWGLASPETESLLAFGADSATHLREFDEARRLSLMRIRSVEQRLPIDRVRLLEAKAALAANEVVACAPGDVSDNISRAFELDVALSSDACSALESLRDEATATFGADAPLSKAIRAQLANSRPSQD